MSVVAFPSNPRRANGRPVSGGGAGSRPAPRVHSPDASETSVSTLLESPTVTVRDTCCRGTCRDLGVEEWTTSTQLVFAYRGIYVRHVGRAQAVAEANQVVFFNAFEGYRVSHPVPGGDASLTLLIGEEQLRELAPRDALRDDLTFRQPRLRIDARAQALLAVLRHGLREDIAEPLEAESLALTLVQRALGPRTSHAAGASFGRQRLVDRAKLVLASDLSRRWTLHEIGTEVCVSPVYLTQVFQRVEGMPLYRYQLRLRLARALDLMSEYDDLTTLALELGFSSHSHFSSSFRQVYGRSPSAFRNSALRR